MAITRPSKDALRKRGQVALARARKASGGQRIGSDALWLEIQKMVQDGLNLGEISFALKRTERYLRMVKAEHSAGTKSIAKVKQGVSLQPGDDGYEETRFTTESFVKFFERFSGKMFPQHAWAWVDAFVKNRNLILNVPPRHAKSTIFSIWVPIWLVCRDRNVQILLVSETSDLAIGWAAEIAGQLELNDELTRIYGQFVPEQRGDTRWKPASGELIVRGRTKHAKGAQLTIQSRGMDQRVLGMECDYVIADDPTSQESAESETKRMKDLKHLRQQVLTRIEPEITLDNEGNRVESQGGRAAIIGQRVHLKDMYGELARQTHERGALAGQPLWHVESYPAISVWPENSDDGRAQVLWPERWPFEELMVTYERVGGFAPFSCLYQQQPMPDGAALIEPEWFERCKDKNRMGYEGVKIEGMHDTSRVCSIDPSPNNFHALVVADVIYDRTQFAAALLDVQHFKGGLRDLVERILAAYKLHNFDYLVFEESGFAKWFFEDPLFNSFKDRFKVIKHNTNINKNDREYGIQSLAADVEFNRLSFPYGDADGRRMTELWGKEALEYPEGDTDDILMATWFIKWNWKKLRPIREEVHVVNTQPWSFLKRFNEKHPNQDKKKPTYSFYNRFKVN